MERKHTGFIDINGVDISEGDIIKYVDTCGMVEIGEVALNSYLKTWGVKKYNLDESYPEEIREQGYVFGGSLKIFKNIEVIGNVEDNPDLLQK